MQGFIAFRWKKAALVALLSVTLVVNPVLAKSPVKLQKWSGEIDFSTEKTSVFSLEGTASHLGAFTAQGEVDFVPGEDEGTYLGLGVVVFKAANGDLLVGNVLWEVDVDDEGLGDSEIHFTWADSVKLHDGTVVENTGRFVDDRPPGLVVIAIIAILIGLLVPAVQQVPGR
jgi:hypothetical protein